MEFKKFIGHISDIKNKSLPGESSQLKMAPPFRQELLLEQKDKMQQAKRAAVMALFYPNNHNQTTLVLILRQTYKGVHSGQIAFPGGKFETSDMTLQQTALRETEEEIGVSSKKMTIVKSLTPVYIPPSNFYVQPFLAMCANTPSFVRQKTEVKQTIELSLEDLLNDDNISLQLVKTAHNTTSKVPTITVNKHIVWGATAMILSEIKDLLKQVL